MRTVPLALTALLVLGAILAPGATASEESDDTTLDRTAVPAGDVCVEKHEQRYALGFVYLIIPGAHACVGSP